MDSDLVRFMGFNDTDVPEVPSRLAAAPTSQPQTLVKVLRGYTYVLDTVSTIDRISTVSNLRMKS
jgi:hypothetical protein